MINLSWADLSLKNLLSDLDVVNQAKIDGSNNLNVQHPKIVEIQKSKKYLMIAHPLEYNYFKILNQKLKWGGRS